jgi:RNA polymerase sigma-70 factor (ECF subfamily)
MSPQEFKERFMPYYKMLYRIAFCLTNNVQDAEDLLQDTFLHMWQKRDLLSSNMVNEAYLIIMLRNLYLSKTRQKTIDYSTPLETIQVSADINRPDSMTEIRNEAFLMKELIDQLPPKEKNVITLYLLDEFSYEEIEHATGLKQGNIRQIVMRGRRKLKEEFTKIARIWMK